jgi:hypothetical protein
VADVVVTVPKRLWVEWLGEGDLAYADDSGHAAGWAGDFEYGFTMAGTPPQIEEGERVYIVAHGHLRGYAPLSFIDLERPERFGGRPASDGGYALVRRNAAVAVTLLDPGATGDVPLQVKGFQGFRYRWWERADEIPFAAWRTEGVRS